MSLQAFHNFPVDSDDRIIPGGIPGWCAYNGFSLATGRRILERGECEYVQLSPRRIGITYGADKRFKASRTRRGAR